MTKSIHLIIKNSIFAIAIAVTVSAGYATAATTANIVPTCVASIVPASISSTQSATLKWDASEGALYTSIDNGVGAVSVDGLLTISPVASTVYTVKTWNSQGEGNTCTATIIVDGQPLAAYTNGQPTVTLQTVAIHPAATQVVLSNVPYTGTAESVLYTLFMLALMLTAGYVAKAHTRLFIA